MEFSEVITARDLVFPPSLGHYIGKRSLPAIPQQCTNITFLADDLVEYDEFFTLTLSTQDPGVVLMPASATVVILNNDCEATVLYS